MKKTIFFILVIGLAIPGLVKAQSAYTSFQYVMGFGMGDLADFISKASFRGATFDYQKEFSPKASVGLELGWSTFYEKMEYGTYTVEPYSLSGVQYRYSNMFPMLATVEYYLISDAAVKPYINLGIGTMYTFRNTDMGVLTLEEKAWQFALKPEIGLIYDLGGNADLKLEAKYYTGIKTGKLETQSFFAISTGLVFSIF